MFQKSLALFRTVEGLWGKLIDLLGEDLAQQAEIADAAYVNWNKQIITA